MNNYMNNPMMDMFKNPMAMWSKESWEKTMDAMQASEMYKGCNPSNWMAMAQQNPWLNKVHTHAANGFNFTDNIKNVEAFADMHKLSFENAQAALRRQAEILQKHAADLYTLMQNMVSSPSPETAMSMQADYINKTFDALMSDFKELAEMHSKSHLEAFETASARVSEHMHKMRHAACNTHECKSKEDDQECSSQGKHNKNKK